MIAARRWARTTCTPNASSHRSRSIARRAWPRSIGRWTHCRAVGRSSTPTRARRSSSSGSGHVAASGRAMRTIAGDGPAVDLLRRRVDRDQPARVVRSGLVGRLLVDELMLGVQQLAPAVEHPDRPGEQPEAPGAELLGDPVLVEEREGELAGAVGDDRLGDAAAALLPRLRRAAGATSPTRRVPGP